MAKGMRRHGNKWEVYVDINDRRIRTSFPLSSTPDERERWQLTTRLKHTGTVALVSDGTFAADVARYLQRVEGMASYSDRQCHLELWVSALGANRVRADITSDEIDIILRRWGARGHAVTGGPLAASSIRHRRDALGHLFRLLDGPAAANPVRGTWCPPDRPASVRALPIATVLAILEAMKYPPVQKTGRPNQQGLTAKSIVRLGLMSVTGLPNKQIASLTRAAVQFALRSGSLKVAGRNKGKGGGTADRWLPITDKQIGWLQAFDERDAYGDFNKDSLRKRFQAAAAKVGIHGVRPYDLKHSFGTLMYAQERDLATVARLLDVSLKTARRYTLGAHADLDAAAMQRANAVLPSASLLTSDRRSP